MGYLQGYLNHLINNITFSMLLFITLLVKFILDSGNKLSLLSICIRIKFKDINMEKDWKFCIILNKMDKMTIKMV